MAGLVPAMTKYESTSLRKISVQYPAIDLGQLLEVGHGVRSSIWCMVWPTRPNSITGQ